VIHNRKSGGAYNGTNEHKNRANSRTATVSQIVWDYSDDMVKQGSTRRNTRW